MDGFGISNVCTWEQGAGPSPGVDGSTGPPQATEDPGTRLPTMIHYITELCHLIVKKKQKNPHSTGNCINMIYRVKHYASISKHKLSNWYWKHFFINVQIVFHTLSSKWCKVRLKRGEFLKL